MDKLGSFFRKKRDSLPTESLPLPAGDYEVFLSFRGPDIRETFADCIYRFLHTHGIRTFFDNEELRKGHDTASNLTKAVEESKICIPIFTSDYASSKWCLQELADMVRCYEQGNGHLILPIFLLVEPREVRGQEGSFGEAFRGLARKYGAETIKEWKEALQKVGKLKGWHVTASDGQGAIIADVFSKVRLHLMKNYKLVTDELVGIDPHVEYVKGLLNKEVKVVGIQGMSGIGKTDIAKATYDSVSAQFDRCCFVENVREILSKNDGIVTIQNRILLGILSDGTSVEDASQGIRTIKDRVGCWGSVLIVLDDVDGRFEFGSTLGDIKDFSSDSRFIITTTDERVMDLFQQYELYQPGEMSYDNALQLFSRHAFGMDSPPQDYMALSKDFVKAAAGLPLALKAIGSLLFRKGKSFWGEKLTQFQDIPPVKVQERLEIIYMELTPEEQHIFLDIACFFIGEHCDRPSYMWSDFNLHPLIVIDSLCLKSLIKINERNEFWMHDLYKNLGRAIVREEDILNPWKRSRIWSNKDSLDILRGKKGTDQLEILRVDMKGEDFELTGEEFKNLSGLKYLEVRNGRLTGDFKEILTELRWLRLGGCSSILVDFSLKKLVILDLWSCVVKDDWSGWNEIKVAPELKIIDVWSCEDLRTPPDLSQCLKLECLNLEGCQKMRGELFVGNFGHLKVLNLQSTKIRKLTGEIGVLQTLQELNARDSSLREVPAGIGKLSSLELLDLRSDRLQGREVPILPISLKLLYLSSPRVPNLLELKDLEELWFSNCSNPEIPGDIWKLSKLKTLKLSKSGRKSLLLAGNGMEYQPALPPSLNRLEIDDCWVLERLPNLANLANLIELYLSEVAVSEIPGLGYLRMLETLTVSGARNLKNLDGLQHLRLLNTLYLSHCAQLKRLPSLSNLTKLDTIEIDSCRLLSEIESLGDLDESLAHLKISCCPGMASLLVSPASEAPERLGSTHTQPMEPLLPPLSKFCKLRKLSLTFVGIDHLLSPELVLDFSGLPSMEELSLNCLNQLIEVKGVERLESLQTLCLLRCKSLRKLPDLSSLENLRFLEIRGCTQLTEVTGLDKLESLKSLNMSGCTSILHLPSLSKSISVVNIIGCEQLTDVMGLEKLESLDWLEMGNCTSITQLPDLSRFRRLYKLNVRGCIQLTELTGMESLKSLRVLMMDGSLAERYGDLLPHCRNMLPSGDSWL